MSALVELIVGIFMTALWMGVGFGGLIAMELVLKAMGFPPWFAFVAALPFGVCTGLAFLHAGGAINSARGTEDWRTSRDVRESLDDLARTGVVAALSVGSAILVELAIRPFDLGKTVELMTVVIGCGVATIAADRLYMRRRKQRRA